LTFASVAGQARYGLPPAIARIESITDRTTMLRLRQITLSDLRATDPGQIQTGVPDSYLDLGYQQVAVQPSAATGLWAVSTSATDTQKCFIETIRTGGYENAGLGTTLTGTSRVALGSLTDHIEVLKFFVSSAASGAISLYDAATSGNELARIPVGDTFARYLAIQLDPVPSSVITYYVDHLRELTDMVNANDEPMLPADFHYLLVEGTLIKEWTKMDDTRRIAAQQDYEKGVKALKYFATCRPDYLPTRGERINERSRFGAWFPATRY